MSLADELHVTQLMLLSEVYNRRINRLIMETAKRIPSKWMENLIGILHSIHLIEKGVKGITLEVTFSAEDLPTDFVAAIHGPVTKWVILLNETELDKLSDKAAISVIAHELAHVTLKHGAGLAVRDTEKDADELVVAWGFEDEFYALRNEMKGE